MNGSDRDIRCVLVQIGARRLLLPNAVISEVLSQADVELEASLPDWLPGYIAWQGGRVPLVAFSQLAGWGQQDVRQGDKIVVLKALGGDPGLPYFALSTRGFPRLVTIPPGLLVRDVDEAPPEGVRLRVRFEDEVVFVPDLDALEAKVREALPR